MPWLFPSRLPSIRYTVHREMLWYHLCKRISYSAFSDFMQLTPKLAAKRDYERDEFCVFFNLGLPASLNNSVYKFIRLHENLSLFEVILVCLNVTIVLIYIQKQPLLFQTNTVHAISYWITAESGKKSAGSLLAWLLGRNDHPQWYKTHLYAHLHMLQTHTRVCTTYKDKYQENFSYSPERRGSDSRSTGFTALRQFLWSLSV